MTKTIDVTKIFAKLALAVSAFIVLFMISSSTTHPEDYIIFATSQPEIRLMGDNPLILQVGSTFEEPGYGADDAEDGLLTDNVVVTGNVDTSTAGTYTFTYSVTDGDGNTSTATRTVIVEAAAENTPPTITLMGDNPLILQVGSTFEEPGYGADDAEDGLLTDNVVRTGTVDTSVAGTYTLTYTVTDSGNPNGNPMTGTAIRTVSVESVGGDQCAANSSPVITLLGNNPLRLNVGATFEEPGYGADDAEDGLLTDNVVRTGTVDTSVAGTYTLTYTVEDSCGATGTATRTVIIESTGGQCPGNIAPIITLLGDNPLVLQRGATFEEPGYGADDAEDGLLTDNVVRTGTVNTSVVGTYILTYTVEDSCGVTGVTTRTVIIESNGGGGNQCSNNTPPTITLMGDNPLILQVGSTFEEPGYGADDAEDGLLTDNVVRTGTVDTSVAGTYILTYTVEDSCGVTDTVTRTVIIQADGGICPGNTLPVITLLGNNPLRLNVGATFEEPGYGADDAEDGLLTDNVVRTGTVDTSIAGTYTLTYTVEDSCGATGTATRTVIIESEDDGGNGGGGNGGGGSGSGRGRSGDFARSAREEVTPIVLGECTYLEDFLRIDFNNDPIEVMKLQAFLRAFEGFSNVEVNGIFDTTTFQAVNAFQVRYSSDILTPWGYTPNQPTGYVYVTTKNKVNEIFCNKALGFSDAERLEMAAFQLLLLQAQAQGNGIKDIKDINIAPKVGTRTVSSDTTPVNLVSTSTIATSGPEIILEIGTSTYEDTTDNRTGIAGVASGIYSGLDGIINPIMDFLFSTGFFIFILGIILGWLLLEWYKGHKERKGQE